MRWLKSGRVRILELTCLEGWILGQIRRYPYGVARTHIKRRLEGVDNDELTCILEDLREEGLVRRDKKSHKWVSL